MYCRLSCYQTFEHKARYGPNPGGFGRGRRCENDVPYALGFTRFSIEIVDHARFGL